MLSLLLHQKSKFFFLVRQLLWEKGEENAIVIHLTLIPYLAAAHIDAAYDYTMAKILDGASS